MKDEDRSREELLEEVKKLRRHITELEDWGIERYISSEEEGAEKKKVEERLLWLASFPSLDPNPIIEISAGGAITYLNLSARVKFPGITKEYKTHSVVSKLVSTIAAFKKSKNEYMVAEAEVSNNIYELHCSYIPDRQSVRAYMIDVTERKKSEKMKDEFINAVTHELRAPLSITKEGIRLLIEDIPGDINEKQRHILTMASRNIDRLSRIIDELLDISRIESGSVRLARRLIDIADIARIVVDSFTARAAGKGLEIRLTLPDGGCAMFADEDKITQIFVNLVGNAIKFTDSGKITVFIGKGDSKATCSVADTGCGISKEDLPRVFSRFQQFGARPKSGEKGSGLGLSIVKGLVELHKGEISVVSEFGEGTKFTFVLPRYTAEDVLKEQVGREIEYASQRDSNVSLIMVSSDVDKKIPHNEIIDVMEGLETVIKENLRRAGDAAFVSPEMTAVLLADCDKKGACEVGGRLEKALKGYLSKKKLAEKFRFKLGSATYPEDAQSSEDLIKSLSDNRRYFYSPRKTKYQI